jgi:hypothetical protein
VGKKSQRDRRRAQLARAAADGDVDALRKRLSQSARGVQGQLLHLLARPGEPGAALLDLVAETVEKLRREGDLEDAAKLAAAAGPRTPALRLEQGLLSFARGEHAALLASVEAHCDVKGALGALAALARGERPGPAARRSAVGVQELTGLARMVSAAASGDRAGVTRASKEVPAELRRSPSFEAVHAACSLATLGAREVGAEKLAKVLASSPLVRGVASREHALADLLVTSAPASLDKGRIRAVAPAEIARNKRRAAAIGERRAEGADPMAAALHAAQVAGEAAFADPAEGALVVGFSRLARKDLDGAIKSFDAAIAGGADLVEALRGRWLALWSRADTSRGKAPALAGQAGAAAERLAHALASRPGAGPYAVLAAARASHAFALAGDFAGVERAGALARSSVPADSLPQDIIAELEVHALRKRLARPDEALRERLRELTTSMPKLVDAWELRLDLAFSMKVPQGELDALILEAFAATGAPLFAEDARGAEDRRARSAPPSPAASLVLDVVDRLESGRSVVAADGRLDPAMEARLAALPADARHAAHAALFAELGEAGRWQELRPLLTRVAGVATPTELGELLVVLARVADNDLDRTLARELRTLAEAGHAHRDTLRAAFEAAVVNDLAGAASAALGLLAAHLTSSELSLRREQLRGAADPRSHADLAVRCDGVIARLDRALHPGYSLKDAAFEMDALEDELEEVEAMLERLSPRDRARLLEPFERSIAGGKPPSGDELDKLMGMMGSLFGGAFPGGRR